MYKQFIAAALAALLSVGVLAALGSIPVLAPRPHVITQAR